MTPSERHSYAVGWREGMQHMRQSFRANLPAWARLRRLVNQVASDPSLNASERAAYRQVQRWMQPARKVKP
jgi:hypothetical protein